MTLRVGAAMAVALLGSGLGGLTFAEERDRVPAGEWGGEHVRLTLTDKEGAIEFDCAHGAVETPLKLDTAGRFDVPGTFVREGGPVRPGREDRKSVRYSGRSDGDRLEFEIVREDGERLGPFRLKLGEKVRLVKCR